MAMEVGRAQVPRVTKGLIMLLKMVVVKKVRKVMKRET